MAWTCRPGRGPPIPHRPSDGAARRAGLTARRLVLDGVDGVDGVVRDGHSARLGGVDLSWLKGVGAVRRTLAAMPAMDDFVLFDGDLAIFNPNFGSAVVMVQPGRLTASGALSLNGRRACVVGDEQQVAVVGCPYVTPMYPIPGMGTLRIAALGTGQSSRHAASDGKALLLRGDHFVAGFDVQAPARQAQAGSASTLPDPMPRYAGQGSFLPDAPALKAS